MAVMQLRGQSKAFAAMSTSKVNATVDNMAAKASAKPKGMIQHTPPPARAERKPQNAAPAAKPKGAASIPRTPPPVHKQAIETVSGKGGRVNQRA